jgi:hypothetical protein
MTDITTETSAERIHSCYISSVFEFCIDHSHESEPRFSGENLLRKLQKGSHLDWPEIEEGFQKVAQRTRDYAAAHGLDPRSKEAARGYWLIRHNQLIECGVEEYKEMPEPQKEACKTRLARVVCLGQRVGQTQKLEIEYENGKRKEVADLIYGNLQVGDYVSTHQWIVAEKLTEAEYQFYLNERRKQAS